MPTNIKDVISHFCKNYSLLILFTNTGEYRTSAVLMSVLEEGVIIADNGDKRFIAYRAILEIKAEIPSA